MMKRVLLVITVLAALAAAQEGGDKATILTHVSQKLAAGSADEVTVELVMAIGDVEVAGGAAALFELDCYGPDSSWAPELDYDESGEDVNDDEGAGELDEDDDPGAVEGRVTVVQRDAGATEEWQHRWDARLDSEFCRELEVTLALGHAKVTLAGTAVDEADLTTAAGDLTLDLRGAGAAEFEGSCETGLGDIHVYVPAGASVRVAAETEMGELSMPEGWTRDEDEYWTSPDRGNAGRLIELDLSAGMGDITVMERGE